MKAVSAALLIVATSPGEFHDVAVLSQVLQRHVAVVVAYDDKLRANGTVPRCRGYCGNLEIHLVRIPLPTYHEPLWLRGATRPKGYCGIKKHDVAYSAATRWRVLAPLTLGLVYRFDFVGWTDVDVSFTAAHLDRMFPLPIEHLGGVDAVHTGIMIDDPRCGTGIDRFWKETLGRAPTRTWSWYGNLVYLNSSYLLRIARLAHAWYEWSASWRYRWGDQQFAGVLELTNATVVDAWMWRDRGFFVHRREAPQRFRKYRVVDPSHIQLSVER